MYYSKDDPLIPEVQLEKYIKQLPNLKTNIFEDRGHFSKDNLPEIIDEILSVANR